VIAVKERFYSSFIKIKNRLKIEELVVDLQKECFEGNVLDIGVDNLGIIYNMCKSSEDEVTVDYFEEDVDGKCSYKNCYDVAVLFFTISKFLNKKKLLEEIYDYLKEDGEIKIWDIDKINSITNRINLKILLPGSKEKNIRLRNSNIFKNRSKESVVRLLVTKFDIIEMNSKNNVYCIKGRKKKEG
jgi:SAM-dependent methyltransferase